MIRSLTSIYLYTDYRSYLAALYAEGKMRVQGFSYRMLADMLGFSSAGTLKLIIDGQRNLTLKAAARMAERLALSARQHAYLQLLVRHQRAASDEQRSRVFNELSLLRNHAAVARVENNQYRYLSAWYNVVIRELVKGEVAQVLDFKALGNRLVPPISPAQARRSVELLLELGFLHVDEQGRFAVRSQFVETASHITHLAVRQFHQTMIQLAAESIERWDSQRREISSLTLHLSRDNHQRIIERIRQFQNEIVEMIAEDRNPEEVCQLNFQLFPLCTPAAPPGDATQ
jgi:uncharacterized protein (TIGR02147 family)